MFSIAGVPRSFEGALIMVGLKGTQRSSAFFEGINALSTWAQGSCFSEGPAKRQGVPVSMTLQTKFVEERVMAPF